MSKKEFLRSAVFLLLVIVMLLSAWLVLDRKTACNYTRSVQGFFNEEENSMEVLFFGSSHMYCSMDPKVLKAETGLESYVLASQQQPLNATYHYIKSAFETQQPKLVVLELLMANQKPEWASEAVLRDCIDPMPWRHGKVELIKELVPEEKRGSYYFNLLKYHGRWKELSGEDFDFSYLDGHDADRGFIRFTLSRPSAAAQLSYQGVQAKPLFDECETQLLRIKELVESEGAQLAFILMPYEGAEEDAASFVAMHEFARQQGLELLDFNLIFDETGLDGSSDYFDADHLNAFGAEKATRRFAQWALEKFDLE